MKLIKVLLKNLIYWILSFFNFKGTVILMYHSVGENPEFSTVSTKDFKKQMDYLSKNGFRIVKLSELVNRLQSYKKIPKRTVCLTFDDGYEDNFLNVFPILKKYSFPAAIFISTAFIDSNFTTKRGNCFSILKENQIRQMAASGLVEFGGHGHRHLKLVKLNDEEIKAELSSSKKVLEAILDKSVVSMTYPVGRFDQRVEDLARKYFSIIGTVKRGRVKPGDKVWQLKRNSIDNEITFSQFKGIIKYGRL